MKIYKRINLYDQTINLAERTLHLSRYYFAARAISKFSKPGKILDAACGLGHGTEILSKQTHMKTIGLDIDRYLISSLKNKFASNNRIEFVAGDIVSLPFKDKSFDYIVCFETVEHLTFSQGKKAVGEFFRILKSRGHLFISSPNPFFTKIMRLLIPKYHNPYHLHEFYPNELIALLNKSGFKIVESRGQYPFFPPLYLLVNKFPRLKFFFEPKSLFLPLLSRYFLLTEKKR